ncbi:SpoIIE family protein phosphatase [Modestobacter sp. VKM Ac-2986]|uniref:PP2C family protein-serine/threonine phosphatase n=1 Tax=Modestobacter sp. VKM Ac-2986 TaxID=3004140 RepID=UPI0022AB7680|nr:SpoIIE family protein phosphatase [Modestobacter sp. VKM Ac-2986]MCZ2830335.1 SpoIIE family protein phosphatase [Modestobacter sp. VKM Ac-2986]
MNSPVDGASMALAAELPSVAHDFPAAVLLIDTDAEQVVFANDLALQLAPDLTLPVRVEDWSRAAGLQVLSGGELTDSSTPLTAIASGDPESGRQVSAALRSEASRAREWLWAIGMPLQGAPEPLRARALLVLLPVRFPEAIAGAQAAAADSRAHRSVLASGLTLAISDPTADDDPLIWVSPSFEQLTGYTSAEALGRNCRFLQGRDTDPEPLATLRAGLAREETVSTTVLNYRHDGSAFYNHLVISPVFDAEGVVTHRVSVQSDVTAQVLAARERDVARAAVEEARRAEAAAEEAGRFGRLLLTMSEALTATTTLQDVAATVTGVLAPELGASSGGLLIADPARTSLEFVTTVAMPADLDASWSRIGWDEDAPLAVAVRTRQTVFHRDVAALKAAHPGVTAHAELPAMGASINLPLLAGADVVGAIVLIWDSPMELPPQQRTALQALARYTAQAVQRASLLADRRSAVEVLQQSLLTQLPEPDHLELRSRYVPAAVGESVGGDWYDAVVLPDGATALVIGDVTGHDVAAAAHMGQLRGLLRAFAYDRVDPPAEIVGRLDRAVEGLHVEGLATLVLARIEQTPEDAEQGLRRLRWTNAGHPPPILLRPDGSTQVLETTPELMIGVRPDARRNDHTQVLAPGATLLLYTDGLIERRGRDLDEGIVDLRRTLTECVDCTLEELLDHLLAELVGSSPQDDCALLAVRAHPEDRPRPAEAGPGHTAPRSEAT